MYQVLRLQNNILEMIATGKPLGVTLDALCLEIEKALPGIICSVLRVERNGLLHPLAAPSLPAAYSRQIDNVMIGPQVGTCGIAAYLGAPVVTCDIAADPGWEGFRDLLLPLGIKACWSSPFRGAHGDMLGTFALYFRERRGPTPDEEAMVEASAALCTIALERDDRIREREHRASTDALTDLPNKASYDAALSHLPCDAPGRWALLAIDLDNLKTINDTFGHEAGDMLLRVAAARIRASMAADAVFRIGGDEFAVIVRSPDALADLDGAAARILAALHAPAECSGHMVVPRATIGGAELRADDDSAETVRQNADYALYHAKELGRGGFVRHRPGVGTAMTERIRIMRDVHAALQERRIDAYYQPIVRLDTGEIVGVEALCRLIQPDGVVIPAAAFHQATADVQIASDLTGRMLEMVAADVRSWLDLGIPFQHVGINISSADFHSGTLYDRLRSTFDRNGVPLEHVIIEVTESVYLGQSDPVVAREIKALRDHGLRVALDDFGTGFASLTHLLSLPVDIIKIDKSFIDRLTSEKPSAVVVEGLVAIALNLDIRVIPEGIETEEQAALLRRFGCTLGQGYLYSRPVPGEEAARLLLAFGQKAKPKRGEAARGLPEPMDAAG
jgi:diguanylate cyclase (GGDEF)-like protein